jgi:hypothetical protein
MVATEASMDLSIVDYYLEIEHLNLQRDDLHA